MNIELDPQATRELETLARAEGKDPDVVISELVHEAHAARARAEDAVGVSSTQEVSPDVSLSGLAGVGKDLWAGEDAQAYVEHLRRS